MQKLIWRFGQRAITIELEQVGATWVLTAKGKREDIIERDLVFSKAAERLKAKIEAKLGVRTAA